MAQHDTLESRTSSPSLSERVLSITTLRARFSSASRTTLVDDHDTETITADESDHVPKTVDHHRSVPAPYPVDYIFEQLQPSKSLGDRISMIEQIARNVGSYPIPILMSTWRPIQDMYQEESQFEARRACFGLATSIADLRDLSVEVQQQLYNIIVVPVPSELLEDQIRSLKVLTAKGARTDPFSPGIGRFLTTNLKRHFTSIVEMRKRNRALPNRDPAGSWRERGLSGLFNLIANIEKQNPQAIESKEQSILLQELFAIAEKTSFKRDMKGVVTVLGPIIRASGIPIDLRRRLVELLCAICNAVEDVRDETKASLFFLLRSDCKDDVVQILLETLSLALNERHTSIVCGALTVLLELLKNKGQGGLPLITFGQFIEPFSHVHYGSRTTRCACLQTISDLLVDVALQDDILSSDWKFMIDTILTATGDEIYEPGQTKPLRIERQHRPEAQIHAHDTEPHREQLKQKKLADAISIYLQQIASSFNSIWFLLNKKQRSLVARFYSELIDILPPTYLFQLIEVILSLQTGKMADFDFPNLMKPEEVELPLTTYYKCMDEFIDLFVLRHRMPPEPYGRVVEALRVDLESAVRQMDDERLHRLADVVDKLLAEFQSIQGGGWQKAVKLAQTVAVAWEYRKPVDFAAALNQMTPLIYATADNEDRETEKEEHAANLYLAQHSIAEVTLALVKVFLLYLPDFTLPSTLLFENFLQIASDRKLSASSRLPALRLLARVRCDQRGSIFITSNADSLDLAKYLKRTEDTRHHLAFFEQSNSQVSTPTRASRPEGVRELRRSRKSIDFQPKPDPKPPLWIYPGGPGLPIKPPPIPSANAFVQNSKNTSNPGTFDIVRWLFIIMDTLQHETDWEVYSYVIVHLPSQLQNYSLFAASLPAVKMLRSILVGQLLNGKFFVPPAETHVKKGEVAFCLLQTLIILLGYAERDKELKEQNQVEFFQQNEEDELVKVFLHGIGTWERAGQICIQALTVACHTIPVSINRTIGAILDKLERYITTAHLTVDILELLATIARTRQIHTVIIQEDHRKAFAICIKYLESARLQRSKLKLKSDASRDYTFSRNSGVPVRSTSGRQARDASIETKDSSTSSMETRDQDDPKKGLPQYVFVLAYHVMTNWFMALRLPERSKHVGWISSKLAWKDAKDVERMEEQSQATLDMMLRTAYSDLGESSPANPFIEADGEIHKKTWIVGLSIITVETALKTGVTHITKRQISGTTYSTFLQNTVQLAEHHVARREGQDASDVNVFPQHIFLQLNTSISPMPSPLEPIGLPDDDTSVEKALSLFDRMDTVDGYRIGVIYVRDGQSTEREILSNSSHSTHFKRFMEGMGTKVALQHATFNTQGLDRVSNEDGPHTYAWRDRLVEIVYYVPSMMPDLDHDPQCTNKKRHVGNSFVTIVWNESGLPYKFDTIASEFNAVNIVITPENSLASSSEPFGEYMAPREGDDADEDDPRYKVKLDTNETFPRLSPCASAKLLPLKSLPGFVRQVALNSAIFSNVWSTRANGEYPSSWRDRLREIVKLRERYGNTVATSENAESSDARSRRVYNQGEDFTGKIEMGGITEADGILSTLDFSHWAGPVPVLSDQRPQTSGQAEMSSQISDQGN